MPENPDSALETLQSAARDLVGSIAYLQGLPLFHERMLDLRQSLLVSLKSKTGICILVNTPRGINKTPGAPAVTLEVRLMVDVLENPTLNTTRMGAQAAAEQIAAHLHNQPWTGGKALTCIDIDTVERSSLVRSRVTFQTIVQLRKL